MNARTICLGAVLLMVLGTAANAHNAPSGWIYPLDCCSNTDCEPIPAPEETSEGWHIRFTSQRFGPIDAFVPHGRERPSGDGSFHACFVDQGTNIVVRKCNEAAGQCCFWLPLNT